MPDESHLDQAPTILRQHNELHPSVGELLRVPTLVIDGFDPAVGGDWRTWLLFSLRPHLPYAHGTKQQDRKKMSHKIRQ